MESSNLCSGSFTWTIGNLSQLTEKKHYSDGFTAGGCKWRILIYPNGKNHNDCSDCKNHNRFRFTSGGVERSDDFSIYLDVPDAVILPKGWSREASFTITVVNRYDGSCSIKRDTNHVFKEGDSEGGFASYAPRSHIWNLKRGFLVNDVMIITAKIDVQSVVLPVVVPDPAPRCDPPYVAALVVTEPSWPTYRAPSVVDAGTDVETNHFDSFFTKLEEFSITAAETNEGLISKNDGYYQVRDLLSGSPGIEEVEEAKQSLKECLSDLFKLNMKDRLAAAVSTLTRAEVGLSCAQQKSIKAFWDNYDDFITNFIMCEQDKLDFELQKLLRDKMFSAMKRNHETHLSNKQRLAALTNEEEELKKRLGEVSLSKQKLISDWGILVAKSEGMTSKCAAQEEKFAEAKQKKRISEKRMSRSMAAWISLKAQFLAKPCSVMLDSYCLEY